MDIYDYLNCIFVSSKDNKFLILIDLGSFLATLINYFVLMILFGKKYIVIIIILIQFYMIDKKDLQELVYQLKNGFKQTKNINHYIQNIFRDDINELSQIIDLESILSNFLNENLITQSFHSLTNEIEIKNTLENTLSNFDYDFANEQKEIFRDLAKYDQSYSNENQTIFYKLNTLLETIFAHLETLEKLDFLEDKEIHERGVAKTFHPTAKDAIAPRQNHIAESILYNPTQSNELQKKIYDEFEDNPFEIDMMYFVINQFGKDVFKNISKEKLDTLFNQSTYLNSSVKLEDVHIYTSCQICSFSIYKHDKISKEKLANYIDELLKSFFDDMFQKPLTRQHISKPIQIKSFFNGTIIYEYQNKKNYKVHPIFQNV